jgi:hypothetical protein
MIIITVVSSVMKKQQCASHVGINPAVALKLFKIDDMIIPSKGNIFTTPQRIRTSCRSLKASYSVSNGCSSRLTAHLHTRPELEMNGIIHALRRKPA